MNAENKITFESFTERVAKRAKVSNTEANAYLHELSRTVGDALEAGDEVKLYHFGRFHTTYVDERQGHNPQTGEALTIPEQTRVDFTPYKALLLAVNWPFRNLRTKMLVEKEAGMRPSAIGWLLLALALLALILVGIYATNWMFSQGSVTAPAAVVPANTEPAQPTVQQTPVVEEVPVVQEAPVETETAIVAETPAVSATTLDTAPSTPAEPVALTTMLVGSGDTLWGIAVSQWGDSSWWPVIYVENRADLAARNPDLIETGSSLRIPVLAGSAAEPMDADISRKAEAYRIVADDYEQLGHARASEYRLFVNRNDAK